MTFDKAVTRVFKFDNWQYSLYCGDNASYLEQNDLEELFEMTKHQPLDQHFESKQPVVVISNVTKRQSNVLRDS